MDAEGLPSLSCGPTAALGRQIQPPEKDLPYLHHSPRRHWAKPMWRGRRRGPAHRLRLDCFEIKDDVECAGVAGSKRGKRLRLGVPAEHGRVMGQALWVSSAGIPLVTDMSRAAVVAYAW